jgi:hypothetical protein
LIVTERFQMSAPKAENGFVDRRIVSSRPQRRNNRGENASDFNDRQIVRQGWRCGTKRAPPRKYALSSPSPRSSRGEGRDEGLFLRMLRAGQPHCLAPHPKFAFSEFRPLPAKAGRGLPNASALLMAMQD